jgi:FKBP-type peptidyl-prolyl cis-trans isomerase FklB
MKSCFISILALGLFVSYVLAQDKPDLTNPKQKISYALGMDIVSSLKRDEVDIDMNAVAAGMADMQAGKPALTPAQQKAVMMEMQKDIKAKAEEKKKIAAAKNLKDGQAFLVANANKEGVKVIEVTAPDGSKTEVQYKILKSGAGPLPKKGDILKLNYEGRLIDGTVFDSSVQRGIPWTGHANDFIAGWIEPLQMMRVGDKWRLFIPPSLGYGEFVPYNIGPNSTLIYDIELLGIEKSAEANSDSVTNMPAK